MNPWICPRCDRVYAPFVFECKNCNDKLDIRDLTISEGVQEDRSKALVNELDECEAIQKKQNFLNLSKFIGDHT